VKIFNRNGWVETSDEGGARETCERHPLEWTTRPWIRPGGAPNVNVPDSWQEQSADRRIDLARQIKGGDLNGETPAALGITDRGIADEIIRKYLAGSTHPDAPKPSPTPPESHPTAAA
jgi:hypothetical protein